MARERPDEYRDPPPFGFAQGRDDDSSEYGLVVSAFKVGNSERGKARRLGAGLWKLWVQPYFLLPVPVWAGWLPLCGVGWAGLPDIGLLG